MIHHLCPLTHQPSSQSIPSRGQTFQTSASQAGKQLFYRHCLSLTMTTIMMTMSIIMMTMSIMTMTMSIMMTTLTKLSRREADMMAPLLSNGLCGLSEGHHYYYDDDYNDDGVKCQSWDTMLTWGHGNMKTRGHGDLDMKTWELTVEVEGKIVEHSPAWLLKRSNVEEKSFNFFLPSYYEMGLLSSFCTQWLAGDHLSAS